MTHTPDEAMFGVVNLPLVAAVRARLISRRLRLVGDDARPLHMVATGRTGSGKTTLGNRLLGIDYFLSHGGQDCTREVNHIRFPGGLLYSDLPGVCSDDMLENFNRAALGLPQLDDFPVVPTLTVATYSGDGSPARQDHPVDRFASAHPPTDLLLYVVAADKQFTSGDRRYLRDLLVYHQRVVYVLNVFSASIPTRANIQDVVSKIASVHRVACGCPPLVVAVDCRSGDGMADLLAAARTMLDTDRGQLLTDLIADQERNASQIFTADLCRHLIGLAAATAALRAGPRASEHPIHRLAAGLWQTVDNLRTWADRGEVGGIAAYRTLVAETLGLSRDHEADARANLNDLVQHFAADIPDRVTRHRNIVRDRLIAAVNQWQAELSQQQQALSATSEAYCTASAPLDERRAEVEHRRRELESLIERVQVNARELQVRSATFDHETGRHERDRDSLSDQIDDFNGTLSRVEGQLDMVGTAEVNRIGDRLNREAARINRRADSLHREAQAFNRDLEQHRDDIHQVETEEGRFNQLVREFNADLSASFALRNQARRLEHVAQHSAASFLWAKERCLGAFYPAEAELSARLDEFRDRLRSTLRRAAAPLTGDQPDRFTRLEAGLRGAATDLLSRVSRLRTHFARFQLDRVCDRVLIRHTSDHFDDQGDGGHRGSTYTLLAADAAALVFAIVHAGAVGDDSLTALDNLVERYRASIGELPTGPLEAAAHLSSSPDLIGPEFELALAKLVLEAPLLV